MVCSGIARLYVQSPGIVSHCCIIAAQAVIGECSIVESSAMARIQLNGSAVVPEGFLKSTLYSTAMIVGPAALGMQPPSAPVLYAIKCSM